MAGSIIDGGSVRHVALQHPDGASARINPHAEALAAVEPIDHERILAPEALRNRQIVADATVVVLGVILAFLVQTVVRPEEALGAQREHLVLTIITFPVWIISFAANKMYQARAVERRSEELRRIVHATFASSAAILGVAFAYQFKELSRLWLFTILVVLPLLLLVERTITRRIFTKMRESGTICRPVLIIGTDADAVGLLHAAQRSPQLGYRVVGFVGPHDIGVREGVSVLGEVEDTFDVLEATGANGVLISLSSIESKVINRLTRQLTDAGYHVALSSGLRDIDIARFRHQDLGGRTLVYVEQVRRDGWRAVAKRVFDVVVSVAALIVTAPVMLVATIAVKLSSPGPIFFKQERVGREGLVFEIYKLRTMCVDAEERKAELVAQNEADGPMFKIAQDPRVTRAGRILRKLSIDEIPQFVNVLKGEMSVVGPRPALPGEVEEWSDELYERLRVLPGITGMWQVSGRSDTSFDEYKRLDLFYVDNWSLVHDLTIVLRTFGVVLNSRGAR